MRVSIHQHPDDEAPREPRDDAYEQTDNDDLSTGSDPSDEGSGEIPDWESSGLTGSDLARAALESARRSVRPASGSGQWLSPQARDARKRAANRRANTRRGGYSGSGPDERDPQTSQNILGRLFSERGWEQPLAEARVFADWAGLVGADIAARSEPVGLREGELRIAAQSTAWATQLRSMSSAILARLVAELGPKVVTKLIITGPVAPSWKHGGWSVRGHRGPRDTYG